MVQVRYRYRLLEPRGFEFVTDNVGELIGYTPEEHYEDPDLGRKVVHPDYVRELEKYLGGSGRIGPLLIPWVHKDGHVVWTRQYNTAIRGTNGEIVAYEGVAESVDDPVSDLND